MAIKTIYVVSGQCGSYSDHREWDVRAFTNAQKAQAFRHLLQETANRILAIRDFTERAEALTRVHEDPGLDPQMTIFDDGPEYGFFELDLET